jgi:hypothetical protein
MKDRHGNVVELGDIVRVVDICRDFLEVLPEDERFHVMGMLNKEYPIDDFPDADKASVSIWWDIGDGIVGYSGLYMLFDEFELVSKADSNKVTP